MSCLTFVPRHQKSITENYENETRSFLVLICLKRFPETMANLLFLLYALKIQLRSKVTSGRQWRHSKETSHSHHIAFQNSRGKKIKLENEEEKNLKRYETQFLPIVFYTNLLLKDEKKSSFVLWSSESFVFPCQSSMPCFAPFFTVRRMVVQRKTSYKAVARFSKNEET